MEVKELRIGNIVKIDDEYLGPIEGKVTSLNEKAEVELLLSVNKGNIKYFRCGADDIFPMPITEELLLKIGFKKDVDANNLYRYAIDNCLFEIRLWDSGTLIKLENYSEDCVRKVHLPKTPNVHQLQNAYYLLTGKELETLSI